MIPLIAHGPLGPFDELFAILAVAIFLILFLAPLVRVWLTRQAPDGSATEEPAAPEQASTPEAQPKRADRFKLE